MMTDAEFITQIDRLSTKWGAKHYDRETVQLLYNEVAHFPIGWLIGVVSTWIGTRPSTLNKIPLLTDFREAKESAIKRKNAQMATEASQNMARSPNPRSGLGNILSMNYPGAKSLNDAVRKQIKLNNQEPKEEPPAEKKKDDDVPF